MNMKNFSSATDELSYQDHLLTKIIISTQWELYPTVLNNECAGFSSVTNEWQFQDHLPCKTLITERVFCPRRPE